MSTAAVTEVTNGPDRELRKSSGQAARSFGQDQPGQIEAAPAQQGELYRSTIGWDGVIAMNRPIVLVFADAEAGSGGLEITGDTSRQARLIYTHTCEDARVIARRIACDAIVIDGVSNLDACCATVEHFRDCGYDGRVVVLVSDAGADSSERLLAAGAGAVLPRANSTAIVLAAVCELLRTRSEQNVRRELAGELNERDRRVLELLWDGYSNKEIAAQLNCSVSLVKASLQRCFAKAGVHSRTQLMRRVIEDRKWPRRQTALVAVR